MSADLLLHHATLSATDRVLAFGAPLAAAAHRVAALTLHDDRVTALEAATASGARLLRSVQLPQELHGAFDAVLLLIPPIRDLNRRYLVQAQLALRPGGRLYLAGPNDGGVQTALDDARALFGTGMQLALKARWRVGAAVRQPDPPTIPRWVYEPGIAPYTWLEHEVPLADGPLRLRSLPGVFAAGRLDAGTALLLEQVQPLPAARVLDIGCGCGVLGLAAWRRGAALVDMLDISLSAVASAAEGIALNAASGVHAHAADGLAALRGARYDLIVTNPPFHQGKATDNETTPRLLTQALGALTPRGRLVLVANGFLPYQRQLAALGATVTTLAENRSFRVLEAKL